MDPFLDRYYDEIDRNLSDPHTQKRLTKAQRYLDLHTIQNKLFEELMSVAGLESLMGRTEAVVTLVATQEFYDLPVGFRMFISMEKRSSENPRILTGIANTIPTYSYEPGIEIISGQRGFRVQPVPSGEPDTGDWTMIYLREPVKLHYATAGIVSDVPSALAINAGTYILSTPVAGTMRFTRTGFFTAALLGETVEFASPVNGTDTVEGATEEITAANANYIEFASVTGLANDDTFTVEADWCWLVAGTPATDAGERVATADYYNGALLRIYSATAGDNQVKEIMDYYYDADSKWHFKLRHPWGTLPTGSVKYEICPEVPLRLDSIYALDAAIMNSGRRSLFQRKAGLLREKHELWNAVVNYFSDNTMDRMPERIVPERGVVLDPYNGGIT